MGELTPKGRVLAKWPGAQAVKFAHAGWAIMDVGGSRMMLTDNTWGTEHDAWSDAASRAAPAAPAQPAQDDRGAFEALAEELVQSADADADGSPGHRSVGEIIEDFRAALDLAEVARLAEKDPPADSPDGQRLSALATVVETREKAMQQARAERPTLTDEVTPAMIAAGHLACTDDLDPTNDELRAIYLAMRRANDELRAIYLAMRRAGKP